MPYLLLFIALSLAFRYGRAPLRALLFCLVCVWGAFEAIYGLLQLTTIVPSRHPAFAMTGHFDNPGPFGGFAAMAMALAGAYLVRYRRRRKGFYRASLYCIAAASFALGVLVLPASMSRAGWLALAAAALYIVLSDRVMRAWMISARWRIPVAVSLSLALLAGAFLLKSDSALGRLHIWRVEALAIADNPPGSGPSTALGAYGEAQERFFRAHLEDVPEAVVRVAGCPEYPFNEYLGLGMEYGVAGLLLSVAIVVAAIALLYRRRDVFAAGMLAWSVFALASYPLSVTQTSVLLVVFLASAVPESKLHLRPLRIGACTLAAVLCVPAILHLGDKSGIIDRSAYRELYSRAYFLYQAGEYEQSNAVLTEGAAVSSDPMFRVIMGRNCEALGDVAGAEEEYLRAYYMVPCRIYPLVRLMRLKIREGRDDEARAIGEKILSMPLSEGHRPMLKLRRETEASLDSLRRL